MPIILTNIMNTFGEMQDAEKLIPKVIKKILTGGLIQIHSDKTKKISGARYWLHARNTSDALLFMLRESLMQHYPSASRPLRFNIVGGKQISNLDIVLMIEKIVGKKANYEMVDAQTSRPGHDSFYGLSGEKLKSYGHEYPKNLEESFEKTILWYINNERWLK